MINRWTLALAAAGLVSPAVLHAEEQHQLQTALSQTTLSGYVDTSAIWSINSPNGAIAGRTFDGTPDKLDGFNLEAVKLVLEKPLDEGQWSAGYKADLVFGPDANYYSTVGNGGVPDGSSDFNVKQAYVALRAPIGNGLDIKLGVWDTLIGYEVFESVNNPNFSRSYGYFIEPTHHTGVLLSYHVSDWLSLSGGVANGWSGGINDRNQFEDRKAYLGSLTITLPESAGLFAGSSIYAGIVYGETANALATGTVNVPAANSTDVTSYYVGTTVNTGLTGLSAGAALDYRDGNPNTGLDGYAWTGALYLSYQATPKLKLNARAEYAKGSVGTWYGGGIATPYAPGLATAPAPGHGPDNNELGALTLTADYSLWANVITRAELRWDHNMGGDEIYHNTGIPGQNDSDINAVTLAANIVYKF
jgi:hypothetical protein